MEESLKKAIKGDANSFIEVIKNIEKDMYIIAKSKLIEENDVKDCIQETVLLAYKNIKKLKDLNKFKPWVVKILINNCNKIRNSKNFSISSYEEIEAEKFIQSEDMYIEINSNIDFFTILDCLNEDEKLILVMIILEGYTSLEISQILNINENTVRSKYMRAKLKIKQKYGKE